MLKRSMAAPERDPILILVTGDPVPRTRERVGGFGALIRAGIGEGWSGGYVEHDARTDAALPDAERFAGIIVTGSASSVTERAPWILRSEEYLADAVRAERAVLGICFEALGGLVEKNPNGREMGPVGFERLAEDPLLDASLAPALAHATHVDSVTRAPPGAKLLAKTRLEPNAALRFGERAWGVQFHPEFDAQVMRDYLAGRREILSQEGFDPDLLIEAVREADAGRAVLGRFVRHALLGR